MPAKQIPGPNDTVPLYRIENPLRPSRGAGNTSHPDLVGQWFSPSIDTALLYADKATYRSGRNRGPIAGANLLVAHVAADMLDAYHVSRHPIASGMDVEPDNFLIPRDGTVPMDTVYLDEVLGEVRDQVPSAERRARIQERVYAAIGYTAVEK